MTDKTFYITTPIYYVNDAPHLGHAYASVAADVLARFKRLDGFDVRFLTGTDEHGQKVEQAAKKAGLPTQEFVDRIVVSHKDMCQYLKTSNDDFIRTSEPRHRKAAQALWKKIMDNGYVYLGKYAGWYAVRDEAYYGEDELTEGPGGKKIAPSGAECVWMENEESYFFKLSAFQDKLLAFYDKNPDFIRPSSSHKEVLSFVKSGLKDLSITRSTLKWGIPFPGDEKHVMYVWVEAVINYISALGYPETSAGSMYAKYWPHSLHLIGKEIARFHAIYWPAFLMAAGLEPPHKIFCTGWWVVDGQKMSKSIGNVVKPKEMVDIYGLDQLRYFLMREVPLGNDGNFSRKALEDRINHELANDYGNLVQRVLSMINKNCAAAIPTHGKFTDADEKLLQMAESLLAETRTEIDRQALSKVLDAIWRVIGEANRYVDEQAPWALRKTDIARMNTVLYVLAEVIRHIAILTQPFMPDSSARILDQLAVPADKRNFACLDKAHALTTGTALPAPQGVFPRYVGNEQIAEPIHELRKSETSREKTAMVQKNNNLQKTDEQNHFNFTISPKVSDLGVKAACFAVYGLDNATSNKQCNEYISSRIMELKKNLSEKTSLENPILIGFRKLHEKIGKTGKRWIASPENLRHLLIENPDFPRVNTVVDLYNIFSLESALAMGAHDIEKISGNVSLRLTDGSEGFTPIGSQKPDKVSAGEYAYCDDSNEVICRMEVRQVEKTKVTPKTRDVFLIVQGNEATTQQYVEETSKRLAEIITKFLGGTYKSL